MKDWVKYLVMGVLSVAFGVFTLGAPVVASFAVTTVLGALLLLIGILQIAGSLMAAEGISAKMLGVILGVLMAFLGLSILAHPLEGMISLAMLVLILLIASGIVRVLYALKMTGTPFFWPMIFSGVISLGLAAYIFANFAVASVTILGIMLGIELLTNGLGLVVLAFALRSGKISLTEETKA